MGDWIAEQIEALRRECRELEAKRDAIGNSKHRKWQDYDEQIHRNYRFIQSLVEMHIPGALVQKVEQKEKKVEWYCNDCWSFHETIESKKGFCPHFC